MLVKSSADTFSVKQYVLIRSSLFIVPIWDQLLSWTQKKISVLNPKD